MPHRAPPASDDVDTAGVVEQPDAATLVGPAHRSKNLDSPVFDAEAVSTVIELANAGKTVIGPRPSLVDPVSDPLEMNTIVELAAGAITSMLSMRTPSSPNSSSSASSASTSPSLARPISQPRYELVGEIGHGGGGDVFEVKDTDLRRNVALKRLRREHKDPGLLTLFLQEAQLTAQLEHPNIVPVHELGKTASGEPFFTMKRVTGQTLHDVLSSLQRRDPAALARFTRTRLLVVFLEITRGVAHAHARGVVHRDLKPANILIGSHGETLVADWGLAFPDTLPPEVVDTAAPLLPVEWPAANLAEFGISGTLLAMAPEQAVGDALDRRIDVYALGVLLYELLTGERPFAWRTLQEAAAPRSLPVPPRARAPHKAISDELEAICLRCLQPRREDRYGGAGALSLAVENALTGARRRQQAQQIAAEAHDLLATMRALHVDTARLQAERAALLEVIKPWDDETIKAPLWQIESRLFDIDVAADDALAATLDKFNQALGLDPGYVDAEDALADLHLELFLQAERSGNRRDQLFHRRLVVRHHRGRYAAQLEGKGFVTLRPKIDGTDAVGAVITAVSLVEQGKRIVGDDAVEIADDGRVHHLSLPMGSTLFTLTPPAHEPPLAPVTVHVHVGRQARLDLDVRFYDRRQLDGGHAGFVQIPAGPFIAGGDDESQNAGPRREVVLPDFFIARTPVTCGEYLRFLNAVDVDAARQHVPRTKPDGGALWEADSTGRYALPVNDADGNPVIEDAPVMGVSFFDAQAYAAWLSIVDDVAYRLPTEDEWEKAARGVDGRFFPWGNGFDPTFCKMATSRPGRPQPEAVMTYPVDVSVYGVHDTAGGIREWCESYYDASRETRTLRGGAWYFNPGFCRTAFRHGYLPHIVFTNFGFRLAKSAPL